MNPSNKTANAAACRILVVDDEEDLRILLARELRQLGHDVVTAADAQFAISAIEEGTFDIVVTDIRMPRMNGIQLTEWIKTESPETEVIVVTGDAAVDTAVQALRLGAFDYVTKPFGEIDLLSATIDRAVEKRRLEDQLRHRTAALGKANADLQNEINERREAETEVRRLKEFNDRIIEGTPVALAVLSGADRTILSVNPAFCSAFDIEKEAAEGKNLFDGVPHLEESDVVRRALSKEGSARRVEAVLSAPNAADQWFNVLTAPLGGEDVLLLLQDITESRKQQRKLQQASRLASIGQLVAGVAHEINNPLSVVAGFSEILMEEDLPDPLGEYIGRVFSESLRAAKIVQDLLTFARSGELELSYLDIGEILDRVLDLKQLDLKGHEIEVDLVGIEELPKTMVDEDQIFQVLLNVVTNAEQAMHSAHAGGRLAIATHQSNHSLTISFTDDGPGIPPNVLPRVFDPFFTSKGVGEGTGLGLSISHGIIELHGGSIRVESRPGQGATFHIELPIMAPEAPPTPADRLSDARPQAEPNKRVLVVDDESGVRDLLAHVLTDDNYAVDVACEGQQALEMVRAGRYECILTDLRMPGIDGRDLYQAVRDIDPEIAARVIFITGGIADPDMQDFVDSSPNPVITKPFNFTELRETVHSMTDPAG